MGFNLSALKAMSAGKELRAARKKLGLTMGDVADKLQISVSSVSDVERGKMTAAADKARPLMRGLYEREAEPLHESAAEAKGRLWVLPFERDYEFRSRDGEAWQGSIDDDCLTTEELELLDNRDMVTILYDKETKVLYHIETPGDHR